jgi:hypothetical protein
VSILDRSESRQGAKVIWLAVHSTEGNDILRVNDAVSLRDAAWWTGSSHAITDNEALLTPAQGCVPYDRAAWTLRGGNRYSDNIEQVGWARWSRAEWLAHPGTLDHTARWLAERSTARGIPLVKLSPAEVGARKAGVIGHWDYTLGTGDGSHTDPGPSYPWDVVIDRARAYAAGEEDDMAAVPQNEWNEMRDKVRALIDMVPELQWRVWRRHEANPVTAPPTSPESWINRRFDAIEAKLDRLLPPA